MHILYLYNLLLFAVFPIFRAKLLYFIVVTFPFFLLFLPETGHDFGYYESAYDAVFFDANAPLFFRSAAILTAEPGWFAYTGLSSYVFPSFRSFLVFNFLLCLFLLLRAFDMIGMQKDLAILIIAVMIPISFVTIMFWSPRSALPFSLCIYGLAFLQNKRIFFAFGVMFLASMIHSQYAPIIVVAMLFYFFDGYILTKFKPKISIIISFGLISLFLLFLNDIVNVLSFLPSIAIIQGKLISLESYESNAIRMTGLLSIIVYPIFVYLIRNHAEILKYRKMIFLLCTFSFVVNVAFFNEPHIAGRTSRASDYFLFAFMIAFLALKFHKKTGSLLLVPFFLVFPFLFPSLYNYEEIMSKFFD